MHGRNLNPGPLSLQESALLTELTGPNVGGGDDDGDDDDISVT